MTPESREALEQQRDQINAILSDTDNNTPGTPHRLTLQRIHRALTDVLDHGADEAALGPHLAQIEAR